MSKVICNECHWTGDNKRLLNARHPFNKDWTCAGCPSCRHIDCFSTVCDEPQCWERVECGTPTPSGYRNTCEKHRPTT